MVNKLEKMRKENEAKRFQSFLEKFKTKDLQKIIHYHSLACANFSQRRSLLKSLRESNLNYQDVWKTFLDRNTY